MNLPGRSKRYRAGNPTSEVGNALTAAGARVTRDRASSIRRLQMPWQARAFAYYDILGEIKYAAGYYSRGLAGIELYAAETQIGKDERPELVPTTNETARALLDRIQDPGGGRSGLLSAYGRLMFLAGEANLFVTKNPDTDLEQWEMLSTQELRITESGKYERRRAPQLTPEMYDDVPEDQWEPVSDDSAVAYRLWKRHPLFSSIADATMQGVLELCVAEGTMVNTTRGPVPIEEVRVGSDDVYTWSAGGLARGRVRRNVYRGEQDVVKVTAGRRSITCTADHPLLVLRKDKPGKGRHARYECEWIEAGTLEAGDHLVALDHGEDYGKPQRLPDGTPVGEDVAWLLGQIVGDGHVHREGVNISVYDDARRARISAIVDHWWGLRDHPQGGDARYYSRALSATLELVGLRVKSHQKRIPAEVLASPEYVKRAFLAGYEEADGHMTSRGWQSLALTSPRLARELHALYIELGENVSNLHIEERAAVMAMPGGLSTENAKPLYRFQVYYGSNRRGKVNVLQAKNSRDAIGGEHFTLATVKSVDPAGTAHTYDLEIEGDHNYIAGGIVSHNCEELVLLTQAVRARTRSRLAGAGILLIDDRIGPKPLEAIPDEDMNNDPLLALLIEAMTTSIVDEGTASAVVPLLLRTRAPDGRPISDLLHHLQLVDPLQLYPEEGLRSECIRRIAIGLDMPPEVLTGSGGINHWQAWLIDESGWKWHLQPIAQQLVDDLNSSYYRPALKQAGVADWQNYSIAYDASAIINRPDRSRDAKDLHKLGVLGDAATREATGFAEDDAPTEEERRVWLSVYSRDPGFALTGEVTQPTVEDEEPDPPEDGERSGESPADVQPGMPERPDQRKNGDRPDAERAAVVARVVGAADSALLRAREVAGNRLRSLANKNPELRDEIKGVQTGQVAVTLGPVRVRGLSAPPDRELVRGAGDLVVGALRALGIDGEAAARIADAVEQHAARTLYERNFLPLPPQFVSYVEGLFAAAEVD